MNIKVEELIENKKDLKVFKSSNAQKKEIYNSKNKQENISTNKKEILKITESFTQTYTKPQLQIQIVLRKRKTTRKKRNKKLKWKKSNSL